MRVLEEGTDHEHDGGEEDEHEGDDGHDPGAEAEAGILKQIPPPLLGATKAGVGEDVHVVFLSHTCLLHLILPPIVEFLR